MKPRVTSVGLLMPPPPPAIAFASPAHLTRSLDALPARPGVYVFRAADGAAMYVGKSVNVRNRVLSHLRTAQEEAMLLASASIECVRTGGELGALLLESHMIKRLQPAFNVMLRDSGELFALYLPRGEAQRVTAVGSFSVDFDATPGLHGLFASRSAAQQSLRELARVRGLCPVLLGLDEATAIHGRACFAHQLGRCRGACIGKETAPQHKRRLQTALRQLQTQVWPYDGPIGVTETCDGWRQTHVIDRWNYLGILDTVAALRKRLRTATAAIDIDTFKILSAPLRSGALEVEMLRI